MAYRNVEGDGPVVYFTDQGQQQSIPLSSLLIDDSVNPVMVKVAGTVAAVPLQSWVRLLVEQGRIRALPDPPAGPAMTVTAYQEGSSGNNIVVTVARNNANAQLIDVTVVETDVYAGVMFNAMAKYTSP